jgi:hypothetical protein
MTWEDDSPLLDVKIPSVARIYDYLLGGKDNFAADRDAGNQLMHALPRVVQACRDNRDFLQRAVRYLAAAGVRQFIDVGSGLPTAGNVHEVAQEVDPCARVAYVDYDPIVLAHARALLADSPQVAVIGGDLRKPGDILAHPSLVKLIDFREPVAVLLVAVLHFVTNDEHPHQAVREITAALPARGYLALSHVTADEVTADASAKAQQVYAGASAPGVPRTRAEITRFFDGLDLVPPGVTDVSAWHPEIPPARPQRHAAEAAYFYGGIAVKR